MLQSMFHLPLRCLVAEALAEAHDEAFACAPKPTTQFLSPFDLPDFHVWYPPQQKRAGRVTCACLQQLAFVRYGWETQD